MEGKDKPKNSYITKSLFIIHIYTVCTSIIPIQPITATNISSVSPSLSMSSTLTQHTDSISAACDRLIFYGGPELVAKQVVPNRPSLVFEYVKGFSTVHDMQQSTTIRIRCLSHYPVIVSIEDVNSPTMNTSNELELIDVVDTDQGWTGNDVSTFSKAVDFLLPPKVGKYLVKCFSTHCNQTGFQVGLGIDSAKNHLRVFPIDLSKDATLLELQRRLELTSKVLTGTIFGAAGLIMIICGCSIFLIRNAEKRYRSYMESMERRSHIPLSEMRSSIIPELSTTISSGFAGEASFHLLNGTLNEGVQQNQAV